MKTLLLRIENQSTLENGGPVALTLAGRGAHVGRNPGMDWVLPDPSRHISGLHFEISVQTDSYYLTDVSSNGTFLHGERYRIDGPREINDGDRFTVGQYIIKAELAESHPPPPAAPRPAPPPLDEFDDIWGNIPGARRPPFAPVQPTPEPMPAAPRSPGVQSPMPFAPLAPSRPGTPATQSPDFYRIQGQPPPQGLSVPPTGPGAPGLAPGISPPPSFSHEPAFSREPAFPPEPPPQPPTPYAPTPIPPSPPGMAAAPPAWQQPAPYAPPPHAGNGQHPSPYPAPAAPPPTPAAPPPVSGMGTSRDGQEFLYAFLEAAGVHDPSRLQIPPAELARILGRCVRAGTTELMHMLQDRAAVKLFVNGEDRTMRVASGNNPLKLLGGADQAFEALFLSPREGYLTGAEAFENALSDLRRHQTAVIAALQPALADLLEGLSPDDIKNSTPSRPLRGGSRKVWAEFVKRWENRAARGENGMLDAFVEAFSRHYADAVRKQK